LRLLLQLQARRRGTGRIARAGAFDRAGHDQPARLLRQQRFDVGFYVGRLYGLAAATFILVVLLTKTGALYARLSRLLDAEQRGGEGGRREMPHPLTQE
jgi:hypothetical protein